MLDGIQCGLPVDPGSHRLAQRGAETIEWRGAGQKGADILWLSCQDFLHQIIDEIAVRAIEPEDGFVYGMFVEPFEHQPGELQSGSPPFRQRFEAKPVHRIQHQAESVAAEGLRLHIAKGEILQADLRQAVSDAQTGDREGRILTGQQHQPQIRWLMRHHLAEHVRGGRV